MTGVFQSPAQLVPCSPFIGRDLPRHSPVPSIPSPSGQTGGESPRSDTAARGVPCTPTSNTGLDARNSYQTPDSRRTPVSPPCNGEQIVPNIATPGSCTSGFRVPHSVRTPVEARTPCRRVCQQDRISNLRRSTEAKEIDLFNGEDIFD